MSASCRFCFVAYDFLSFKVFVYEFAVYKLQGDHGLAILRRPHIGTDADGFAVSVLAFLPVSVFCSW